MSHRKSMPRVYYYRLRQQHAGFEADDGLRYRGGGEADHKETEGAGVFAREEVPNQNQNQVFSLENEESDDFLEEEQLKHNLETKERPVVPEDVSKPASKSSWMWQVWSLLLAIAHLIRSIFSIGRTIWTTKSYRYGLLGALLLGLLFYLWHQPGTPVGGVTKPVAPSPLVKQEADHLPLNVEILVKRLLDQQLSKKHDDLLARVMQKIAADKEDLKRRSKEELLHYLDDKLNKMDTMLRSRLNAAPATDDFSKEMKELEARMRSELQRLTREVNSGKDGASDAQRGLQTQIDTIQHRIGELTRSLENQPQTMTGPSAIEQALPAELQELRTDLSRLLNEHQRMALRVEDQDAEAARLRERVTQLVSTEDLNAELVRVREAIQEALSAAAAAAHPPTQPAQLDQEVLVTTVLAKVLARWDLEKQSLIDDLRARDQQVGQVAGEPVDVARHKDTIMAWVHETIARELKGVEGSVAQLQARLSEGALTPAQPQAEPLSAEQIVTDARVLIQQWIKEQHDRLMPEVIQSAKTQILPDVNERILSGEEQTAKALDDQRKQIDALDKRQNQLDASLRTVAKERSTMVLSDEQLREVVRMLNANRAVSAHALAEEQVREIVREELDVFAADRVNMTDWALGAAGARILPAYTSDRYGNSLLALVLGQVSEPPSAILTTSLTPGHCWAFGGDHGNATIQLPCRVRPTAFTVDHIARGVARDFRSAPQHFRVWGFENQAALADETKAILLGEYRYDIYGPQVQTFPVQYARPAEEDEDEDEALLGSGTFKVIKMGVYSNYGHEDFTCVYRFRVHGSLDA